MDVKITDSIIPIGAKNRIGKHIEPTFITIHECSTGLEPTPPEKNREHYIDLMRNPKDMHRLLYF